MQLSPTKTPTLAGRLRRMIVIWFWFLDSEMAVSGRYQENREGQINLEMAGAGCQGQEEEFQDAEVHEEGFQDAEVQEEEFQDAEDLDEAPAEQNQAGQNPERQDVTEALKLQIAADQWWIGILYSLMVAVVTGSITVGIYLSEQSVKGSKLTCPRSCAYPTISITVFGFFANVGITLIWREIIKKKESLRQKFIEAENAVGQGKQAIAAGGGTRVDTGGGQWLQRNKFRVVCFVVGIVFWFVLLSNCWVRVCLSHDTLPQSPQLPPTLAGWHLARAHGLRHIVRLQIPQMTEITMSSVPNDLRDPGSKDLVHEDL